MYIKTDATAKNTASIPFLTSSDETFEPTDSICKNFIFGTIFCNKLLTLVSTLTPSVFSTLMINILSLFAIAPALNVSSGLVARDIECRLIVNYLGCFGYQKPRLVLRLIP